MKWLNTLEINKLLRHFSLSLDIKVEKDVAYSGMIFTCALLFIITKCKCPRRTIGGLMEKGLRGWKGNQLPMMGILVSVSRQRIPCNAVFNNVLTWPKQNVLVYLHCFLVL